MPKATAGASGVSVCARAGVAQDPRPPSVYTDESPSVFAECDGRLREILLQYVPSLAEELEPTYDDLFDALPVDVDVQVLCPTQESAALFNEYWGNAGAR